MYRVSCDCVQDSGNLYPAMKSSDLCLWMGYPYLKTSYFPQLLLIQFILTLDVSMDWLTFSDTMVIT